MSKQYSQFDIEKAIPMIKWLGRHVEETCYTMTFDKDRWFFETIFKQGVNVFADSEDFLVGLEDFIRRLSARL